MQRMPKIAVGIVLAVSVAALFVGMDSPTGAQVYAPYAAGGYYEPYQNYNPNQYNRYTNFNTQYYQPRISPYYNAYSRTDPYQAQYGRYSSLGYSLGTNGQWGLYRGYYDTQYPSLRTYSPYSYSGYNPYSNSGYTQNRNYDYLYSGYT